MQLFLRIKETWAIILMLCGRVISLFCWKEKKLWLFCERGTDARDNGYWMFRYMKEQHPEINAKFIITDQSEDRKKLSLWGNELIKTNSLQHYIMVWLADYCISTHLCGCYPYYFKHVIPFRKILCKLSKSKNVNLKHGIFKDDLKMHHYEKNKTDLLICGAKPEYDYIQEKFGYPEGIVKYTGLARFDNLPNDSIGKRQILLMPTWRYWLKDEDFVSSEYYLKYVEFLSSKLLHKILDEKNVTLVFYPHYEVQKYISEFKKIKLPSNIIIADKKEYDVQQLLIESSLLITDYSSVYFDFVYMRKPVIYYQFDEKRYRNEQYQNGYYDYHNGLGEWTDNEEQLIQKIKDYINLDFEIPSKYSIYIDEFFPIRDNKNCERIYNEIVRL